MPWWGGGGGRASPSDDDGLAPRSLEELQAEEEKARAALDDKKLQAWQRADRRLQEATRRANTPAPPFAGLPNPSQVSVENASASPTRGPLDGTAPRASLSPCARGHSTAS